MSIPILLYHSVAEEPPSWIQPYTVPPDAFARHLDAVLEADCTPLTVSTLCGIIADGGRLPERPVVITFDDGFADFAEVALPAMSAREMVSTLYLTTGAIGHLGHPGSCLPPARMLESAQLGDLESAGVELAAHSHTHPQLDVISSRRMLQEVEVSKALLEDFLGHEVPSFAYPHGFQTSAVRRAVRAAGYQSACAVRHAISSPEDDPFALARLMLRRDTPLETLRTWLRGRGAPVAPFPERLRTRAWRCWRRTGAGTGRVTNAAPPQPTGVEPSGQRGP